MWVALTLFFILYIFVNDEIACNIKIDEIVHIINEMKGMFNITKGNLKIPVGLHITKNILTKTIHIY
jgi:hypothetical protein